MNRTITQATLDAVKAADYTKEDWHYPYIEDNPDVPEFVKGYLNFLIEDVSNCMLLTSEEAHERICDVMGHFLKTPGDYPEPPL